MIRVPRSERLRPERQRYESALARRLMAGRWTLDPEMVVRVHPGQLKLSGGGGTGLRAGYERRPGVVVDCRMNRRSVRDSPVAHVLDPVALSSILTLASGSDFDGDLSRDRARRGLNGQGLVLHVVRRKGRPGARPPTLAKGQTLTQGTAIVSSRTPGTGVAVRLHHWGAFAWNGTGRRG